MSAPGSGKPTLRIRGTTYPVLLPNIRDPRLHLWTYDPHLGAPALHGPGGRVPLKPFCGTLGVAPAEPGQHSIVPPRRVGGNLDIRDLAAGAELLLPVEVAGALFSLGDTHAAQGDGEICGTAIESPLSVVVRFDIVKNARLRAPRFTTPGPVTNVVSERLSWRAIDCICSLLTSAASSKTASGLPENGSSPTVKTLTIR